VTLLVDAVVIVGGVAFGRWIVRRLRTKRASEAVEAGGAEGPAEPEARDLPATFPCKIGDVVMRVVEGDEAWLAGAMVLAEDRPVAALFVAPEAGGDHALFVRDAPGSGVTWLWPMAKGVLAATSDPPHTLEHEGVRYQRERRLPVRVSRVGSGAPSVGDRAVVAEYVGPGNARLLIVAGASETLAWKGVALAEGEYDVLPGGK
jgi:hypothetical protein